MKKETKNNVREWTDEDERKYRKMLATPLKKPTEEEMFKLTSASPHPPLGASNEVKSPDIDFDKLSEMQRENRKIMENLKQATETPMFGQGNDNFAQAITEAGIKAAKATHEFNMMEIKAKMLADLCNNIIAYVPHSVNPQHPEFVTDYANKLVEQTLGKL